MSILNRIFPSKGAADAAPTQINAPTTAPAMAAPPTASAETTAAVKSVLASIAGEVAKDALKIALITQQLMDTQEALLKGAGPNQSHQANARAREEIRQILAALRALHSEFESTGKQLQQMSK